MLTPHIDNDSTMLPKRILRRFRPPNLLLAAVCTACGPGDGEDPATPDLVAAADAYAAGFCDALADCDCNPSLGVQSECRETASDAFTGLVQDGYALDQACLDRALAQLAADPCAERRLELDCEVLSSDRGQGEACAGWHPRVQILDPDPCGPGLHCNLGTCQFESDPTINWEEGHPCFYQDRSCRNPDLFCTKDNVCAKRAPLGEPCVTFGCEVLEKETYIPLFCAGAGGAGTGVCEPQRPLGEPCDVRDLRPCQEKNAAGEEVLASCDSIHGVCVPGLIAVCESVRFPLDNP